MCSARWCQQYLVEEQESNKSDSKDICIATKDFNYKKMLFYFCKIFWIFLLQFLQEYEAAQLFSILMILTSVSWAANQHNRMISE